jgi:Spy/CpxP family protein refolding chaperone
MNALTFWKTSTLVLAGALAFTLGHAATEAQAEPQPNMQAALRSLEEAKASLEKATSDKGGHRVAAIKLTKEAIEQVKKGIEHDENHGKKKSADDDAAAPLAE